MSVLYMSEAPLQGNGKRDTLVATVGLIVIFAIATVILWPAMKSPAAYDDLVTVSQVQFFESWTDAFGPDLFNLYRPVKNLFFYFLYHGGATPLVFHLSNLAAFFLATIGVYHLSRRLGLNLAWGLAAAALWTFSAANTTLACWTSCFNISIAAAGMCFSLAAWDRWRENPKSKRDLVIFLSALVFSLLAYETAIAIAPLAVMIDLYRGRPLFAKSSIARYAGIAVVIIAWLALRHQMGASTGSVGNPALPPDTKNWQLSASAPYFLWTHFSMWAAPWGRLEVLGSYTWNMSVPAVVIPFCWILLLGTATLCVRFWSSAKLFVLGLAWFFIASFPSGNFVPLGNTPYADYYVGIPAIGLCIALAAILAALLKNSRNPSIDKSARNACTVLLVALIVWRVAAVSEQRVWAQAWKDPVVVMAYTANARPHQYLAKSITAGRMAEDGNLETARFYAESAVKDAPWLAPAHMAMADVLYREGKSQEAIEAYLKTIESTHVSPRTVLKPHFMIGQIIGEDPSKADQAFEHLFVVLREHSSEFNIPTILYTADLFKRAERPNDQLAILKRGLEYHPSDKQLLAALEAAKKPDAPKAAEPDPS